MTGLIDLVRQRYGSVPGKSERDGLIKAVRSDDVEWDGLA
jgi:hypothetical protein